MNEEKGKKAVLEYKRAIEGDQGAVMPVGADFTGTLKQALAEVEAAGHGQAAEEARSRCFAAYTSSSEWLGEVGEAVSALLREHRGSLPETTRRKLRYCLDEVAKVWPKYRST